MRNIPLGNRPNRPLRSRHTLRDRVLWWNTAWGRFFLLVLVRCIWWSWRLGIQCIFPLRNSSRNRKIPKHMLALATGFWGWRMWCWSMRRFRGIYRRNILRGSPRIIRSCWYHRLQGRVFWSRLAWGRFFSLVWGMSIWSMDSLLNRH